ncbi:MAG TPA: glycosyl transferase [Thermodesulfobacteriota bacterium]|nr:glycosyl transferase [Thermodesulfobacteriota bacterium]
MGDFHQTGVITTLHRLRPPDLERLEGELTAFGRSRPLALVLPCLYSELAGPALGGIVRELARAPYIRQIVVALDRANRAEYDHARRYFEVLPQETRIVWIDGPDVQELFRLFEAQDLPVAQAGKGRAAWIAYGYVLASGQAQVIALHDCDVIGYSREMLARLCYPVMAPNLDYEFCKGYYARVTDRLHGRVTRLLLTPLIRALERLIGTHPFLAYLDSFRYPLAGEFAMVADLARINRVPADWGLEVGVLAEVYRNCSIRRVCQIDIADAYEHKHQELSPDDPGGGLHKMAIDIAKALFRTLASEGVVLSEGLFKTLLATYLRAAQDAIKRYEDDAAVNGLVFDRHTEGIAVDTFTRAIRVAGEEFLADPLGSPHIPNWNRVTAAIPDALPRLREAVEGARRAA